MSNGGDGAAAALGPLARILGNRPQRPADDAEEHCELCMALLAPEHPHLVNLQTRGMLCACRPCSFLFEQPGSSPRFRTIPTRYQHLDLVLENYQWDALQIPVGLVFVFANSQLDRTVAFYPSPAGPTESLLDLESWRDVVAANPQMADAEQDVEAVLLRRNSGLRPGEATERAEFEGWVVPIDACYELVGLVRLNWRGFDGGQECWAKIEEFFAAVAKKAG